MIIKIKRYSSSFVIFEGEYDNILSAVLDARKNGAYLGGADLGGADLRGADLRGADLRGAYLGGADLRGADLRGSDLRGADLRGAYLRGADLRGAYLRGAYLGGAHVGGAHVGGAHVGGAHVGGAIISSDIDIKLIPHQIITDKYYVIIWDQHIKIGCEFHEMDDWFSFDDKTIIAMDGKDALRWWNIWKEPIKQICINTGRYKGI